MKKKIANFLFNEGTELIFAIRREVRKNGTERLTPVVRKKGWFEQWIPIVNVDGYYMLLSLDIDSSHTEETCTLYINEYRDQLVEEQGKQLKEIIYQTIATS